MSSSSTSNPASDFGPNEWLVEEMYQRFLDDPATVDPAWHEFFADYRPDDGIPVNPNGASTATAAPSTSPGPAPPPASEPPAPPPPPPLAAPAPKTPPAAP
ncbi:MAG: hypothetical protein L0I24_04720, partial [Pseudonocardia sp.]|nr:hypothetical protein [Pseudonocardia sp.]